VSLGMSFGCLTVRPAAGPAALRTCLPFPSPVCGALTCWQLEASSRAIPRMCSGDSTNFPLSPFLSYAPMSSTPLLSDLVDIPFRCIPLYDLPRVTGGNFLSLTAFPFYSLFLR